MDAEQVDRRYRAFNGFVDTYTYWIDGSILKLSDSVDPDTISRLSLSHLTLELTSNHIPGMIFYHKRRHLLCIACANGTWCAFRSWFLKGRKKMSALGFYNTFIRPVSKQFKVQNRGQKPIFVVGKSANNISSAGVYSSFDLERLWVRSKAS